MKKTLLMIVILGTYPLYSMTIKKHPEIITLETYHDEDSKDYYEGLLNEIDDATYDYDPAKLFNLTKKQQAKFLLKALATNNFEDIQSYCIEVKQKTITISPKSFLRAKNSVWPKKIGTIALPSCTKHGTECPLYISSTYKTTVLHLLFFKLLNLLQQKSLKKSLKKSQQKNDAINALINGYYQTILSIININQSQVRRQDSLGLHVLHVVAHMPDFDNIAITLAEKIIAIHPDSVNIQLGPILLTPLHSAAAHYNIELMRLLLEKKADPTLKIISTKDAPEFIPCFFGMMNKSFHGSDTPIATLFRHPIIDTFFYDYHNIKKKVVKETITTYLATLYMPGYEYNACPDRYEWLKKLLLAIKKNNSFKVSALLENITSFL